VCDEYGRAKLLVLDDLGAEAGTDTSRAMLLDLVEERQGNKRMTIVTSNLAIEALDRWDPRIASRISTFWEIAITGDDRRRADATV
jgi:DNA replication protein DnaC